MFGKKDPAGDETFLRLDAANGPLTGALGIDALGLFSGDFPFLAVSGITDAASAEGFIFDTANDLATAGAKNFIVRNFGTELFSITKDLTTLTNQGLQIIGTTGGAVPTGVGTRLMWVPQLRAFRAGGLAGNPTAWDLANIGLDSAAFGRDNMAAGQACLVTGFNNTVSSGAANSLVGGAQNNVTGGSSLVVGLNQTIGGNNCVVAGTGHVIQANDNIIGGTNNGVNVPITGGGNLISGASNNGPGQLSLIAGLLQTFNGVYNVSAGLNNQMNGVSNVVMGSASKILAGATHTSLGGNNTITGGSGNTAIGVRHSLASNSSDSVCLGSDVVQAPVIGNSKNYGFGLLQEITHFNTVVLGIGDTIGTNPLATTANNQMIFAVQSATPQLELNQTSFIISIATQLAEAVDLAVGTITGSRIATAAAQKLGFWGAAPVIQPVVTGSRASGAALVSLLTQLATAGLIVDNTVA